MLNVLCINNLKYGRNCKCNDQPSITHILLGCVLITNTRGQVWSTVENTMPPAIIAIVNSMSQEEKVVFIYKCLNGPPIKEWLSIYRASSVYMVVVSKEWYEKVRVLMCDDCG